MFPRDVLWLACWTCLVAVVLVAECRGPCIKGLAKHQCSFRIDGRGEARVLDMKRLNRLFRSKGWTHEKKRPSPPRFFEVCCHGDVFYLTLPKLKPPCMNGLWLGECAWRARGRDRLRVTDYSEMRHWEKMGWKVVKRRPPGGPFREVCCSGKVSYMVPFRPPTPTPGRTRAGGEKPAAGKKRSGRRKRVSGKKPAAIKKPAPGKKPATGKRKPAPRKKKPAQENKKFVPGMKLISGKEKPALRKRPTPAKTLASEKKSPQKKAGQGKQPAERKKGTPEIKQNQKLRNTTLPRSGTVTKTLPKIVTAPSTLPKNETPAKTLPRNETVSTSSSTLPKTEFPPTTLPENVTAPSTLPKTKTPPTQTARPSSPLTETSEKPKTALPEASRASKTGRSLQPLSRRQRYTAAGRTGTFMNETALHQGGKDVKVALSRLENKKPFAGKMKEGYSFESPAEEVPEDLENAVEEFHEKFAKEVMRKKDSKELE